MYPYDQILRLLSLQEHLERDMRKMLLDVDQAARLIDTTQFERALQSAYARVDVAGVYDSINRAVRAWPDWQEAVTNAARANFEASQRAQEALSSEVFKSIQLISKSALPQTLAFSAIISEWQRASQSIHDALRFRETPGGSILDYLATMASADSEEDFLDAIDEFTSTIADSAERLPKTPAARLGLWLAIVSFIFQVYTFWDQRQFSISHEDQDARIDQRLARIEERFTPEPPKEFGVTFRVIRQVRLYAGPSTDSPVLCVLPPNSIVTVKEQKGRWLEVEAFSFVDLEVYRGWIYKRFLRSITPEMWQRVV